VPLFMDVHDIAGGMAVDAAAKLHLADLQAQGARDANYLRYWVDQRAARVFCLAEAPSADAAVEVHRRAHGLIAGHIYQVQEGSEHLAGPPARRRRIMRRTLTGLAPGAGLVVVPADRGRPARNMLGRTGKQAAHRARRRTPRRSGPGVRARRVRPGLR
jgi:hypothetical protein